MGQAVIGVEVLSELPQRVHTIEQRTAAIVDPTLTATVRALDATNETGVEVVAVAGTAAQRIDLLDQARIVIVSECQFVAIRQFQTGHIARGIQLEAILFSTEVATGNHPTPFVVVDLGDTVEHVTDFSLPLGKVVLEMVTLTVAGPVLDHTRLMIVEAR